MRDRSDRKETVLFFRFEQRERKYFPKEKPGGKLPRVLFIMWYPKCLLEQAQDVL